MNTSNDVNKLRVEQQNVTPLTQDQISTILKAENIERLKPMLQSAYDSLKDMIPNLKDCPVNSPYYSGKLSEFIDVDVAL
jgi:hypothetical protein